MRMIINIIMSHIIQLKSVYEHGADKGFQMRDRSQLVISGCLDIEEHHVLLDKSIEKYKEYYLTNKYFE